MKAIKHITAGLLHIEVIGQVPDPTIWRARAGRSQPTSKAQSFYNLKSSWRELELMLAANFGAKDMVLTATVLGLGACRRPAASAATSATSATAFARF